MADVVLVPCAQRLSAQGRDRTGSTRPRRRARAHDVNDRYLVEEQWQDVSSLLQTGLPTATTVKVEIPQTLDGLAVGPRMDSGRSRTDT